MKVPPAAPTETDLAPFGNRETVPEPALTVPENDTSLAVIEMGESVEEMDLDAALLTLPVPSVTIVTPVVPTTFSLRVTAPFVLEDVCSTMALPERRLEPVMLPLAIRVSVPLDELTVPDVPMLAEAPVVVTVKLPLAVELLLIVTAPALVTSAVPVALTNRLVTAV